MKPKSLLGFELIIWWYRFLHTGIYLETQLPSIALPDQTSMPKTVWWFTLNTRLISQRLEEVSQNPNKTNFFGYLLLVSAYRGIFATFIEILNRTPEFLVRCQYIVGDQRQDFYITAQFIRNTTTHTYDPHLRLSPTDHKALLFHTKRLGRTTISFDFVYKTALTQWSGDPTYGVSYHYDAQACTPWTSLWDIFSRPTLFRLAELCYNLCLAYRMTESQEPHQPTIVPKQSRRPQRKKSLM